MKSRSIPEIANDEGILFIGKGKYRLQSPRCHEIDYE